MSSFEFEFSCRVLKSILEFDFSNSRSRMLKSNFEFVFFVSLLYSTSRISIFDSNLSSKFSMACSIRLLEFRFEFVVEIFVSLLNSISRISIVDSTSRISIFDSNFDSSFECKFLDFSCRICRRNFRCLALFDFSKLIVKFDFSKFEFSIRIFDSSALNLMIRNCRRISNSS